MAAPNEGFLHRLKTVMQEQGITQQHLAKAVSTTQSAVSQWLSGSKVPQSENIEAISKTLKIRVAWLETGSGQKREVSEDEERAAYRKQAIWSFRPAPADGGRDYGNANVWSFDPGLDVLVREVLQNARDAGLSASGVVDVIFRIIRLTGEDLRDYERALRWAELKTHLDASTTNKQKLGILIRNGLKRIEADDEMLLLTIEDRGTSGLTGPEMNDGKFMALVRNNLDSNKENSTTKGGAFGLGKAVLWRASRLSTVLFCSNLHWSEDGKSELRVIGKSDLPWHQTDATSFAGPGWFGCKRPDKEAVSFWDNQTLAKDLYLDRQGSGTTACVVGFHDASSDQERKPVELGRNLVNAAADHFFPALFFKTLNVTVEVYDNRQQYLDQKPGFREEVNVEQLQPEYCRMLQAFRDDQTSEELGEKGEVARKPVTLEIPKRKEEKKHGDMEHDAVLLVTAASEDAPSKRVNSVPMFRGPGMVIEIPSLAGLCLGARPFHALLLCGKATLSADPEVRPDAKAEAAEEFLRTAEPPSHNRWDGTPDLKVLYASGCITRLREFKDRMKKTIRELVKPPTRDSGDGPQSLKELFKIGSEPTAQDRPRVTEQDGRVDENGNWEVTARIRMKPRRTTVRITPAVYFLAETGGGQAVEWLSLEADVKGNCTVEKDALVIPPNTREVRFKGTTNGAKHPVPAGQSCVQVDIHKVAVMKGGEV